MSLPIVITNAGLAKLPNPDGTGTSSLTIAGVGVSATAITPDPTMVALPGELSRVTTISGTDVTPNTIHLVMQDSSAAVYAMLSFALYLADGTLFAIYGQATPILNKTASTVALLAVDIQFEQAVAGSVTFGNTSFNNPPASQASAGVVQLATLAQSQAGVDAVDVLTPFTAINAVVQWLDGKIVNFGRLLRAGFQVWDAGNDGAGSGLDADLWQGQTPAAFVAPLATSAQLAAAVAPLATEAQLAAAVAPLATEAQVAALFSSGSNANGYWEKRPDGNGGFIIEQWGIAGPFTGEGGHTVTFPIDFPNACTLVECNVINNGSNPSMDQGMQPCTPTVHQVEIYSQIYGGGSSSFPCYAYWKAKGR